MSVVVMDDGCRGREGLHPLQHWTADPGDAGEDLRRRDCEGGREEEDEDQGLKRSMRLGGIFARFVAATYNLRHFVEAK